MKKTISKKLAAIVLEAQEMEVSYNEGRILDVMDRLDKVVDLLDTVGEALANEPVPDFDYEKEMERYKKSKKYALAVKNNLVLQKKPVDR